MDFKYLTEMTVLCGFNCLNLTALIFPELGRQGIGEQITNQAVYFCMGSNSSNSNNKIFYLDLFEVNIFSVIFSNLDTSYGIFT